MVQQPGAVTQRFADEAEMESLQIADAAMDHLRRGRRSLRAAAALLEQRDVVAAPRQFPRDPRAVDSAADDRKPHGAIVSFSRGAKRTYAPLAHGLKRLRRNGDGTRAAERRPEP